MSYDQSQSESPSDLAQVRPSMPVASEESGDVARWTAWRADLDYFHSQFQRETSEILDNLLALTELSPLPPPEMTCAVESAASVAASPAPAENVVPPPANAPPEREVDRLTALKARLSRQLASTESLTGRTPPQGEEETNREIAIRGSDS